MNFRSYPGLVRRPGIPEGYLKWILVYQDHLARFVKLLQNMHQKSHINSWLIHCVYCMKNNIFVKSFDVNIIFSWFSPIDGNIIFSVKRKLKENFIFSIISDVFRNKSIKQANNKKGKKMIRVLNTVPRPWEIYRDMKDCINNYHITLDLVCFRLYSIVDSDKQFRTAI